MTEADQRDAVDRIAREFIGTPFHDCAELKGIGVDCATLLKCVFTEAGVVEPFELAPYNPQFYLHSAEERYLGIVRRFIKREIALEEVKPGDIVLWKIGRCFAHGAVVVKPGWPHIIHAHFASMRVRRAFGTSPHLGSKILDVKYFSAW